ncbi:MAG: hypothetical protein F6K10_19335 [Moorea sp. SIO2B7]|nr:hypothetical protein [Moorena sp. SIO2B7]
MVFAPHNNSSSLLKKFDFRLVITAEVCILNGYLCASIEGGVVWFILCALCAILWALVSHPLTIFVGLDEEEYEDYLDEEYECSDEFLDGAAKVKVFLKGFFGSVFFLGSVGAVTTSLIKSPELAIAPITIFLILCFLELGLELGLGWLRGSIDKKIVEYFVGLFVVVPASWAVFWALREVAGDILDWDWHEGVPVGVAVVVAILVTVYSTMNVVNRIQNSLIILGTSVLGFSLGWVISLLV